MILKSKFIKSIAYLLLLRNYRLKTLKILSESRNSSGSVEYKLQEKSYCPNFGLSKRRFQSLDDAKRNCTEDSSCKMIYEWKDGTSNKYLICESNARLDRTTNDKESVYVKDMKGTYEVLC